MYRISSLKVVGITILILYIDKQTNKMLAYFFTKPLPRMMHYKMSDIIMSEEIGW
jgi:hypothetical protein